MNDTIRIRLSLGLLVLAVVHAILLGAVFKLIHDRPIIQSQDRIDTGSSYFPVRPTTGQIEKLHEPQSVNLHAQGEVKQQRRLCNPNCPPTRVNPSVVYPSVTPTVSPSVPIVTPNITPMPRSPEPTPVLVPSTSSGSTPAKKAYQIALFVGNDATSRTLQDWFSQNKQLAILRQGCEFQIYTAANPIYKTRFAEIVPADQFPVVLFQDVSDGHIHAAGRGMIPRTADELYSDLKQGYLLYKQAKEAQKTGAVKTRGYSWDESISPTMYLSSQDCNDGYCPTSNPETHRPLDRIRDLFDDPRDVRNAVMWLSTSEIATLALVAVAGVLIAFVLIRKV